MTDRTVNDVIQPPLRRPDIVDQRILLECGKSTIFISQMRDWIAKNPGTTGLDYLHAVTKPHRDANTLPTFSNWQNFAAWVLTLPPPPDPEPPAEVTIRQYINSRRPV